MKRFRACLLALVLLLSSCAEKGEETIRVSDGYRNYYEIFVRSFYDSDGDGLGDLAGVTEKLGYVSDSLGADGIWLMPVMPSPSYHKYDVTDYREIDPQYGTLGDFDALVAAAHARDVRVIIDLVLNHTSSSHPWFDSAVKALWKNEESKYIGYYNFTTGNPGAGYNRITDKYFYECRFVSTMPDLNLDNPDVREEIAGIVQFWLDRGVDGFRLDAVTSFYTGSPEKNIAFLTWLNGAVKAIRPDAYLVGEAWSDGGTISRYYGSGIDSFFNFPYSQATGRIVAALNSGSGSGFAAELAEWNAGIESVNAGAADALFLSNHDHARSAGFLMRDLQREKMAASLYLLAPGNPFIYYGEEIGMTGSGADPNKRLPMVWSQTDPDGKTVPPPGATQSTEGLAGADKQLRDNGSLLNHYRELLEIKVKNPEIARGEMEAIETGNSGIAAYSVTWEGRSIYVFHNLTAGKVEVDLTGLNLTGRSVSGYLATAGGKPRISTDRLTLPQMSSAVLR